MHTPNLLTLYWEVGWFNLEYLMLGLPVASAQERLLPSGPAERLEPQRARTYPQRILELGGAPMRRRDVLSLLGGAAASWPVGARGQQKERVRRIGVLMAHPESDREFQDYVRAFRQGLLERGWSEGRNIKLDFRWALLRTRSCGTDLRRSCLSLRPIFFLPRTRRPPRQCWS